MEILDFLFKAILFFFSSVALFSTADYEKLTGLLFFAFGIILIILSVVCVGGAIGSFILLLGGIL